MSRMNSVVELYPAEHPLIQKLKDMLGFCGILITPESFKSGKLKKIFQQGDINNDEKFSTAEFKAFVMGLRKQTIAIEPRCNVLDDEEISSFYNMLLIQCGSKNSIKIDYIINALIVSIY